MRLKTLMATLFLLSLVAILACSCNSATSGRIPERVLIPSGYSGWVRIDYGVSDQPQLPVADGFYVVRIPRSGNLKTSTLLETGWAMDEFFYVSPSGSQQRLRQTSRGNGGMIWRQSAGNYESANQSIRFVQFFVGREALAFDPGIEATSATGEPRFGPVNG